MSINKIYKIPLLLLTVGISVSKIWSTGTLPTTEELTTERLPAGAGSQSSAVISSTTKQPKTTEELIKDYLATLTPGERGRLREKVFHSPAFAGTLEGYLGVIQALKAQKAIESGTIEFNVTVKSLEFDSKALTVRLNRNDTSLPTIIEKIKQQLDSDSNSIYSMKFISDRQQFQEYDTSLVIYYQDPVSKEFKRYINTPDTQNPQIATPIQLDTAQLATIQFYITFNRLPLKKILEIPAVNTLLRPRTLPTNEQDLKRILQGTCIDNRYDETRLGWACLFLNQTSTDDPLSYTLRRPASSFVKIVRIPRKLMDNKDNRVNQEQVTGNSAEIIKILSPDNSSAQLLFDKRNRLLILKTITEHDWLPSRHEYYLLLNVGNGKLGPNESDKYSSYALMQIDDTYPWLNANPYIEKLAESPAAPSDML